MAKLDEIVKNINKKYGFDIVGKVDISEYKGILTPQFVVSDYVVRGEMNE